LVFNNWETSAFNKQMVKMSQLEESFMSAVLSIRNNENAATILHLVHNTIDAEIQRLHLAIRLAKQKLAVFENKYQVSSDYFIESMTAEDLSGGDDEYICWAGEFKLYQKLVAKQKTLQAIDYVSG
jgi:hypothetical protein